MKLRFGQLALAVAGLLLLGAGGAPIALAEIPTISIDGCGSGVPEQFLDDGTTIREQIAECAESARNHGQFVSCVARLTNGLMRAGVLEGQEEGAIQSCAAQADDFLTADPSERGPFGVGVWESSVEDHIALDGTPRPLPLLVWYPTEAEGEADATLKGIIDAPASDAGPFPVIAFSHGYLSFPAQSTFLMEHMATHGFVVAAMGHPDGSQDRGEAFMNRPAT